VNSAAENGTGERTELGDGYSAPILEHYTCSFAYAPIPAPPVRPFIQHYTQRDYFSYEVVSLRITWQ
jgi:hypothetical protein